MMGEEDFHSLQGLFLMSAAHLRDRSFFRTRVLMLEHTPETAMGL